MLINNRVVHRLRQSVSQHCVRSGVLCFLRSVWDPAQPGLSQTAREVSHHPLGTTGEGHGLARSTQGTDGCLYGNQWIGASNL